MGSWGAQNVLSLGSAVQEKFLKILTRILGLCVSVFFVCVVCVTVTFNGHIKIS